MGDYILPWVDLVSLKAPRATPNSPKPCDCGRQMSSFSDTQQSCLVQNTGGVAILQMEMYHTGWWERWWADKQKMAMFINQMTIKRATGSRLSTCQCIMLFSWSSSLFVVNSWDTVECNGVGSGRGVLQCHMHEVQVYTASFRYCQEHQMAIVLIQILNCWEFLHIARECILRACNM